MEGIEDSALSMARKHTDSESAFYWFLGLMLIHGDGTKQDIEKGFSLIDRSAEMGDPHGQYLAGHFRHHGYFCEGDIAFALKWYERAAEKGSVKAQSSLIDIYLGSLPYTDYSRALYWTEKLASTGNAGAQFNLAIFYEKGIAASVDPGASYHWMKRAAENGHGIAQYRLSKFYLHGEHFPRDLEQARFWHSKAGEQGVTEAMAHGRSLPREMPSQWSPLQDNIG